MTLRRNRLAGLPAVPTAAGPLYDLLAAMRQNIEMVTGARKGRIEPLPADATLEDVVAKVNEIIERMSV